MLIRLLRTHLRRYARPLSMVVALQLVGTIAALYLPALNADIIDIGIARGDTAYILSTGGRMLLVTLAQVLCAIGAVYYGARTAMGFGADVRAAVFHRVGEFSAREVNRFGAPSLITRSTNDVQQVQMLVLLSCTMLVSAPIMCVGGVIFALREDIGLSWLVAVSVPVLVVAIGLVIVRMVPKFRVMQVRIDAVNRILREQITGIRVVRAFVREPVTNVASIRVTVGSPPLGPNAPELGDPEHERPQREREQAQRQRARQRAQHDPGAVGHVAREAFVLLRHADQLRPATPLLEG